MKYPDVQILHAYYQKSADAKLETSPSVLEDRFVSEHTFLGINNDLLLKQMEKYHTNSRENASEILCNSFILESSVLS